jgi:hypothetical protein
MANRNALAASREAEGRARMTHEAWAPPEELARARKWLTGPVATDDYGNEIPHDSSSLLSMLNSVVPHPGQSEEQIAENTALLGGLRFGGPGALRVANQTGAGIGRGGRDVALTVEAVSPEALQLGRATAAEQERYGNLLYDAARKHADLPADATTHKGWGAWGTERNPLFVETYRPGGTTDIGSNPLVKGPAESLLNNLRQQAVGGHRFNELPWQRPRHATSVMLELPKNASRHMVEALNKRFGDSMVVAHRPDTNSVFLTPFGGHSPMPSRADFEALVPGSRVRYGHAEPGRDAKLFEPDPSKARGPMPSDVWDVYSELDYRNLVER